MYENDLLIPFEKDDLMKQTRELLDSLPTVVADYEEMFSEMQKRPFRDLRDPNLPYNVAAKLLDRIKIDFKGTEYHDKASAIEDNMYESYDKWANLAWNRYIYECEKLISICPYPITQQTMEQKVQQMYELHQQGNLSVNSEMVPAFLQELIEGYENDTASETMIKYAKKAFEQWQDAYINISQITIDKTEQELNELAEEDPELADAMTAGEQEAEVEMQAEKPESAKEVVSEVEETIDDVSATSIDDWIAQLPEDVQPIAQQFIEALSGYPEEKQLSVLQSMVKAHKKDAKEQQKEDKLKEQQKLEEDKQNLIDNIETLKDERQDKKAELAFAKHEIKRLEKRLEEKEKKLKKSDELEQSDKFEKWKAIKNQLEKQYVQRDSLIDEIADLKNKIKTNKHNYHQINTNNILSIIVTGYEKTVNWFDKALDNTVIKIGHKIKDAFDKEKGFMGVPFSEKAIEQEFDNVINYAGAEVNKLSAELHTRKAQVLFDALKQYYAEITQVNEKYYSKTQKDIKAISNLSTQQNELRTEYNKNEQRLEEMADDMNTPKRQAYFDKTYDKDTQAKQQKTAIEKAKERKQELDNKIQTLDDKMDPYVDHMNQVKKGLTKGIVKNLKKAEKYLEKYQEYKALLDQDKQMAKEVVVQFLNKNNLEFFPRGKDAEGHTVVGKTVTVDELDFSNIMNSTLKSENTLIDELDKRGFVPEARAIQNLCKMIEYGMMSSEGTKDAIDTIIAKEHMLNAQLTEVHNREEIAKFNEKAEAMIKAYEQDLLLNNMFLSPHNDARIATFDLDEQQRDTFKKLQEAQRQPINSVKEFMNRDDDAR